MTLRAAVQLTCTELKILTYMICTLVSTIQKLTNNSNGRKMGPTTLHNRATKAERLIQSGAADPSFTLMAYMLHA